ncbi:MAG: hypothetical protein LBS37_05930 [Treponema sp.]|jgi:nucleoid-associated protein YgaU|nr:hypothetical protein [Treponema sp.]
MMKRFFGTLAILLLAVLILSCASKPKAAESERTAAAGPESPAARPAPAASGSEPVEDWPPPEEVPEDDPFSLFWPTEEYPYEYEEPAGDIILEGAQTHLVVWGDNLAKVARTYYGRENGYYFPLIMLASRDVISSPDAITPQTQLTIPDLQRNLDNPASRQRLKEYINEVADMYDRGSGNRWDIETRDELRSLASSL